MLTLSNRILVLSILVGSLLSPFSIITAFAATISVDASITQGTLPRYERNNNLLSAGGTLDNSNLQALSTALVRVFVQSSSWSVSEGVYNYSNRYSRLDGAVAAGAAPMIEFSGTPQWLADTSCSGGVYDKSDRPSDYAKYQTVLVDGLTHYKTRYSALEYVQPWNEPDGYWYPCTLQQTDYYEIYKRTANAVATVNALGLPGPALKIGGPGVSTGNALDVWMPGFLDYIKNNNLQLDFVEWHDYNHPDSPSTLKTDAEKVAGWMASRSMNKPMYITEWGWQGPPQFWENPQTAYHRARTAAYTIASHYYWLMGGINKAMYWVIRGASGDSAMDQLGPVDGSVYPVYNTMKMLSMMKATRISGTTDSLSSAGIGVGALAASDNTGLTILLWNYQNNGSTAHNVSVNIKNLPNPFSLNNIQYERYLVDSNHSNYDYDTAKDKLELVETQTLSPRTSYITTINLTANSVSLIVLTPVSTTLNNPPLVSISIPASGASFTAPADIVIGANASDSDGTISRVEFFQGTTKLGEDNASPYSFAWTNVSAGTYELIAIATDNTGMTSTSSPVSFAVNSVLSQTPFTGTPISLPGILQAEDFDRGGETVAYHDLEVSNQGGQYRLTEGVDIETTKDIGGGYNVGWVKAGEWLEYAVNVSTTGTYRIETRVSSNGNGGTFHIEFDGVDKTGPLTIPDTGGWQNWQTLTQTGVSLNAGQQVMRIVLDSNGPNGNIGNFNFITVSPTISGDKIPPASPWGLVVK